MAVMLIAPISTQNIQREWKNRVQEVSWTVQSARAYVDTIVMLANFSYRMVSKA